LFFQILGLKRQMKEWGWHSTHVSQLVWLEVHDVYKLTVGNWVKKTTCFELHVFLRCHVHTKYDLCVDVEMWKFVCSYSHSEYYDDLIFALFVLVECFHRKIVSAKLISLHFQFINITIRQAFGTTRRGRFPIIAIN